ncbi:MAG: hypothetical protein ACP5I8_15070 [Phycisphaerae bacterium]
MKALSTLLVLLVVVLIVVGFYRGWFRISGADNANHSHVTMTVNQAKIRSDKNKVVNDVRNTKPVSSASAPMNSPDNSTTGATTDSPTNK